MEQGNLQGWTERQRQTQRVYVGVEGKDSTYKEGHCSVWRFDSSLKNN